jgi:hypothetical protein
MLVMQQIIEIATYKHAGVHNLNISESARNWACRMALVSSSIQFYTTSRFQNVTSQLSLTEHGSSASLEQTFENARTTNAM